MSSTADRLGDAAGQTLRQGDVADALLAALAEGQRPVDQLVRRADGADPAELFDPNGAPEWLLPVLVAMAGARIRPGAGPAKTRERIIDLPARRRGTPTSIRAAVRSVLSGTQRVDLFERDGGPAQLRVGTYEAETPSVTEVEEAAARVKPLGLVLTVDVFSGATYADLAANHGPTYADDADEWPVVSDMIDHVPES